MKKILALLTIVCVHSDAAIYFESTTSVNRSTHEVTLNVSGSPGQTVTIQRLSNPSLNPSYSPVASQYWTDIATNILNGSGKGTATVDIHHLATFNHFYASSRYGVYRAYQPGSTNQSTNAFMALYLTYGDTNESDVFANITTAKNIADIIINPHDGLAVYSLNGSNSWELCQYSTFLGGWDAPITINTGIGFIVYGYPNLSGVTFDLSGLFHEATISVPIAASGFRILSCAQPISVILNDPQTYGFPTAEIFGGNDSTTTLPVVDGSYVDIWDPTDKDDWSGYPLTYDTTLGWTDWVGFPNVMHRAPETGYLFRNASTSSVTWQFNRQIWP